MIDLSEVLLEKEVFGEAARSPSPLPPCVPHLSFYQTFNANQISLEDGSGSSGNSAKPICQEAKEQSWFLYSDSLTLPINAKDYRR